MGVELDPASASEEEKRSFAKYIALHKSLRHLLHTGDHFRCDTAHKASQGWGVVIPTPPSKYELRSHFEPLDLRWNSSQ